MKYVSPVCEVLELDVSDIIVTSVVIEGEENLYDTPTVPVNGSDNGTGGESQ